MNHITEQVILVGKPTSLATQCAAILTDGGFHVEIIEQIDVTMTKKKQR
ncbi:MAG: hypothetical protein MJK04_38060 [Psychrosphaera sp.]|nr:hypothetical protein [Psychrosphaera sp.]